MQKFVKKPVVIEAIQYTGSNGTEIMTFVGRQLQESKPPSAMKYDKDIPNEAYSIIIPTLEGYMKASKGDYVIKGVEGEFYPCKPDIFEKTYDVVENVERPQTFGEKAVGITFNPSGSDEVYEAKMLAAKQIDLLEKVHIKLTNDSANTSWVRNVLRTQAFNLLVSAQMA